MGSYAMILFIFMLFLSPLELHGLKRFSTPSFAYQSLTCRQKVCGLKATEDKEGIPLIPKSLLSLFTSTVLATQISLVWPASSAIAASTTVAPVAPVAPVASIASISTNSRDSRPQESTNAVAKNVTPLRPTDVMGRIQRLEDTYFTKDDALALERRLMDFIDTRMKYQDTKFTLLFVAGFIICFANSYRIETKMDANMEKIEAKMEKMEAKMDAERTADRVRIDINTLIALGSFVTSLVAMLSNKP